MKILQIDDNNDIRKFVGMTISSMGHEYESADGGKKGLEMIINNKYDMVFLDLSMPEFSGFDVVEALVSKNLVGKQKIIIFSASSGRDSKIDELLKMGVHSFLAKPVDIDDLMEKINSVEAEL